MQAALSPEVQQSRDRRSLEPARTPTIHLEGGSLADDDGSHIQSPSDFNCTAYVLMTMLGLGLLMPWNIVLLALDYFNEEYPNSSISFLLSVAYIYPQLPMLGLVMVVGENFSFGARILTSFVGMAVALVLLPFYAHYGIMVTIGAVLWIGVCTSVLQPSLFGLSSLYPQIYNTGLMSGQGIAGILASVLRIATKIALPDRHKESAIIYFITASASLAVCCGCYVWLVSMPFSRRYLKEVESRREAEAEVAAGAARAGAAGGAGEVLYGRGQGTALSSQGKDRGTIGITGRGAPLLEVDGDGDGDGMRMRNEESAFGGGRDEARTRVSREGAGSGSMPSSPSGLSLPELKGQRDFSWGSDGAAEGNALLGPGGNSAGGRIRDGVASAAPAQGGSGSGSGSGAGTCQGRITSLWRVSKLIWPMMFSIGFVFTATFFVFPGEVVAVKYAGTVGLNGLSKAGWWPVILLTAFQIGDTTGRSLPAVFTCLTRQLVPWASFARLVFIPLWIVAARGIAVVSSDPWTLVLMLIFALTNGYVSTLSFAYAPRLVEPADREKVGFLMGLVLQVGIACGSALSLALS